MGEGVQTALGISGPPVADRFATDAQEVSHLGLREPQLTAMQGTQAQGFQDFVGEFPSIGQRDGHETFLERANGKWHHGISGQLSCRGNKEAETYLKTEVKALGGDIEPPEGYPPKDIHV